MRRWLIPFLSLVPVVASGQLKPELPGYHGNIEQVTTKQYGKKSFIVVDRNGQYVDLGGSYGFTGLTTTVVFGVDGQIASRVMKTKKIVLLSETYERDTANGIAYLRTNHIKNMFFTGVSVQEIELDGFSRPVAWRTQAAATTLDSLLQRVFEHDAVYANGLLHSFRRVQLNHRLDTTLQAVVEMGYDSSGRLISVIERTDGCYSYKKLNTNTGSKELVIEHPIISQVIRRWSYDYDVSERLATLVEHHVGSQYSEEERATVFTYSFEYDERGNWTKKFLQIGSEPRNVIESRRIKYRKL